MLCLFRTTRISQLIWVYSLLFLIRSVAAASTPGKAHSDACGVESGINYGTEHVMPWGIITTLQTSLKKKNTANSRSGEIVFKGFNTNGCHTWFSTTQSLKSHPRWDSITVCAHNSAQSINIHLLISGVLDTSEGSSNPSSGRNRRLQTPGLGQSILQIIIFNIM